jgi:hypothetical protein
VIAQEEQKIHPDAVHADAQGMLSVDAPNPWKLVKALQELRAEVDWLRWESRIVEALLALGLGFVFLRRRAA